MSSLLRNLASQALSLPPAMRPAARLRAGASSVQDEVVQEHEPVMAPKHGTTEQPQVEDVHERTPKAPPSSPTTRSTTFEREPSQAQRPTDRPLRTSLATPEAPDYGDRLEAVPVAPIAPPRDPWLADPLTKPASPLRASPEIDADDSSGVTPTVIRSARQRTRSREAPARFEVSARARERIVQERAAPDVHIHINRVELTALTAPAPSRRAPASPPKQPMSLDQYLQQRRRKTP